MREGTTLAGVLAAAAIAAAALLTPTAAEPGQSPVRLLAEESGKLALTNSKAGRPVLSATGMIPGRPVSSLVRIGNAGLRPANVELVARHIRATPGVSGGDLASALRIAVVSLDSGLSGGRTLYSGKVKEMGAIPVGQIGSYRGHRYRITVSIPDQGIPRSPTTGDNVLQGATTTLSLLWRAR